MKKREKYIKENGKHLCFIYVPEKNVAEKILNIKRENLQRTYADILDEAISKL